MLCGPPAVVTERTCSNPPARVFQVPSPGLPKSIFFARFLNDFSFLLAAFLRGLFLPRPDLLISQTSPPGVWWIGFLLSRFHRVAWIHVSKDMFPENLKVLIGPKAQGLVSILKRLNDSILKKADRILVIGEDMKGKFLEKGLRPRQLSRVSDWADLDWLRPLPKENRFTKILQLGGKFVILYAGNFGRTHNFEDLIEAAEKLRDHPEIFFLLVGDGALKKILDQEIQSKDLKNMRLVPFEPRSRLPEVLAAADVSVILLKRGMAGFSVPSKIYSILASGRPILACVEEQSDIARLVRESGAGFVVPPGQPKSLSETIATLFENPDLRNKLGNKARRFVEARDFQGQAFRDYRQAFQEVLKEKEVEANL